MAFVFVTSRLVPAVEEDFPLFFTNVQNTRQLSVHAFCGASHRLHV